MGGDDGVLTDLVDAVLDGRPFHWIAAEAGRYESTRALIPDLQVVAGIAAMARDASAGQSGRPSSGRRWLEPGATWGRLTVHERVGSGSFGDVYRAFDPALDRVVALKLTGSDGSGGVSTAPVPEARLMARVRHPNVATVYGAERIGGRVGLWMEFIDGRSLEDELRDRGPLPEASVLAIGRDLCAALEAIHRAGLLHRDLKTQNVLRDSDGRVVVTDFGAGLDIATRPADGFAGTPLYLAPEVLAGAVASRRSDLYCLGVLLFHLLTSSFPVTGRSLDEVWAAHQQRRRQKLGVLRPDLSAETVAAIERVIEPDPEHRFTSAAELAAALAPDRRGASHRRVGLAAAVVGAALATLIGWTRWPDADSAIPMRALLPAGQIGVPSRNGHFIPYIDTMERAQIWDVSSGAPRPLVRNDTGVVSDHAVAISPDGHGLVVASRREDGTWELRRLDQSGVLRRPPVARQSAFTPEPQEWSRDGRFVLCLLRQRNGTVDLALAPLDGQPLRVVHTFVAGNPAGARLSPDARFAAVVVGARDAGQPAVVQLFDLEDGSFQVLSSDVAALSEPAWTHDGNQIVFLRDSPTVAGSRDAWAIAVESGRVVGPPTLVAQDLGAVSWVQSFESGQIGRLVWTVSADVYTRDVDPAGEAPPSPPTRIDREHVGGHVAPSWSPDGHSLAYFRTDPAPAAGGVPIKTLVVKATATGAAREVPTRLAFLGGYTPVWTADAGKVVVWASDDGRDERLGYYLVDLRDGSATAVVVRGRAEPANAAMSRTGVFFYRDPDRGIVAHLRGGLREEVLVDGDGGRVGGFRLAHDGRRLAYVRHGPVAAASPSTLVVHDLQGRFREIASAAGPEALTVQAWTPDDRAVLFTRAVGDRSHRLFVADLNGGSIRPLDVSFIRSGSGEPNGLSLHTNGRTIAYPERVVLSELVVTAPRPTS